MMKKELAYISIATVAGVIVLNLGVAAAIILVAAVKGGGVNEGLEIARKVYTPAGMDFKVALALHVIASVVFVASVLGKESR